MTLKLGEIVRPPTVRARRTIALRRRLGELRAGLHMQSAPTSQADVDAIHAFRVLAHSEVQAFLQEIAMGILDVSREVRAARGKTTHALHHLHIFERVSALNQRGNAAGYIYPTYDSSLLGSIPSLDLTRVLARHEKRIKDNSGIKASNINTLFGPLGFRDSWHPPGFLDLMNAFGVQRGNVAHGTGQVGAQQWPSGSAEWARISQISPGLESIERFQARLLIPDR